MAFKIRRTNGAMLHALVAANNRRMQVGVGSSFHADITQITSGDYRNPVVTNDTITAANASSEATAVALANQAKAVINRHFADTLAHDTAVSAAMSTADA